jgi:CDP-glucose 4,6-dehydratase
MVALAGEKRKAMMTFGNVYRGKTVLVTGHTGFKGSWISEWLNLLGAKVVGYSLKPDPAIDVCYTTPYSHFNELGLRDHITEHVEGDVRRLDDLVDTVSKHKPAFIFHLAAQPLVRRAYEEPHLTVETNVLGTLNMLEAVRLQKIPCIMIMITTDKVYENVGWLHSYREMDMLGGHDTYSASKACAELVISSYWRSFFAPKLGELGIAVAPVRGGNVIGGGDWAEYRIVPDTMRALSEGEDVRILNRSSTRPWQHVLELLGGYLHLGALIYRRREALSTARPNEMSVALAKLHELCSPFNFGPFLTSNRSVGVLVEEIFKHWPGNALDRPTPDASKEAAKLNLTIDKAYHTLGWQPRWSFEETIQHTVDWYHRFYKEAHGKPDAVKELTQQQIRAYSEGLRYAVND